MNLSWENKAYSSDVNCEQCVMLLGSGPIAPDTNYVQIYLASSTKSTIMPYQRNLKPDKASNTQSTVVSHSIALYFGPVSLPEFMTRIWEIGVFWTWCDISSRGIWNAVFLSLKFQIPTTQKTFRNSWNSTLYTICWNFKSSIKKRDLEFHLRGQLLENLKLKRHEFLEF